MTHKESNEDRISSTQKALWKVKRKYNKSADQAEIFLKKMGYLDSRGRVKKQYSEPETSKIA